MEKVHSLGVALRILSSTLRTLDVLIPPFGMSKFEFFKSSDLLACGAARLVSRPL